MKGTYLNGGRERERGVRGEKKRKRMSVYLSGRGPGGGGLVYLDKHIHVGKTITSLY
jgi:hypothetical protein